MKESRALLPLWVGRDSNLYPRLNLSPPSIKDRVGLTWEAKGYITQPALCYSQKLSATRGVEKDLPLRLRSMMPASD